MQEKICIHCIVSGLVQGVWFRGGTHEEANKLGLTGWVQNIPNDRVEVMACGEKEKVLQLLEWLKHGPPRARVSDVSCDEIAWKDFGSFDIT
jgi:acylphosphatase